MFYIDPLVTPDSEYFNYLPSNTAKETFFYPICIGQFTYLPSYHLTRSSYDSYLLLYVQKGSINVVTGGDDYPVKAGNFFFINCYDYHEYYTTEGCQCLWCHFDGPLCHKYFDMITSRLGYAFSISNPLHILNEFANLYDTFKSGHKINEAALSRQLTDILTELLISTPSIGEKDSSAIIAESTTYITEHFAEDISVDALAQKAALSKFYYLRLFKKETGYTPHEYLVNTRINSAKYLIKNTSLPIKDICFMTGFSSESVFCTAFKKSQGISPAAYRNQ